MIIRRLENAKYPFGRKGETFFFFFCFLVNTYIFVEIYRYVKYRSKQYNGNKNCQKEKILLKYNSCKNKNPAAHIECYSIYRWHMSRRPRFWDKYTRSQILLVHGKPEQQARKLIIIKCHRCLKVFSWIIKNLNL